MAKAPVRYSPEVADAILERISAGKSLREVCRADGMPNEASVREWAFDDREGFGTRFARATMVGCAGLADEILEIADRASDKDSAAAARVQVDARKWLLSKLLPKIYGDKLAVEHSGTVSFAALLSEARQRRALLDAPAASPLTLDGTAIPHPPEPQA